MLVHRDPSGGDTQAPHRSGKPTPRLYTIGLLLIGISLALLLPAQTLEGADGDQGSASGVFLKLDPAARSSALGSAYTARPGTVLSGYFNPSGLAVQPTTETMFTHMQLFAGISYNHLALAHPLPEYSAGLGVSATSLDYGTQDRTRISGINPVTGLGDFSAGDVALSLSYGQKLSKRWAVGASVKYIQSKLAGVSASTPAGDLGITYKPPIRGLSLGLAARNLGGSLTFQKASDPLPRVLDLGAFYTLPLWGKDNRLNLGAGFVAPSDGDKFLKAGTEFMLMDTLFLRVGYKGNQETGSVATFGAGLKLGQFEVNYSMVPVGNLGNHQRISLSYSFDPPEPSESAETDPKNPRTESVPQKRAGSSSPSPDRLPEEIKNALARSDTVSITLLEVFHKRRRSVDDESTRSLRQYLWKLGSLRLALVNGRAVDSLAERRIRRYWTRIEAANNLDFSSEGSVVYPPGTSLILPSVPQRSLPSRSTTEQTKNAPRNTRGEPR